MSVSKSVLFRRVLLALQIVLLVPIIWFIAHLLFPRTYSSTTAERLPLALSSGPFHTLYYATKYPKGILIVATGDGGWSGQWEEPVALHAAAAGFAVGGWDCRKFADSRKFDHAKLVEAFNAAVSAVRTQAGLPADTPVWYAGWSTGAEWAISAAASPDREKHLVGILSAAPGDVSRYGITSSDLLGMPVSGPGSYPMAGLAPDLHGLSIVVFSGGLDPLDETKWLTALHPETPHRLIPIPGATHDMNAAGSRFLSEFDMALQWTADMRR